MPPQRGKPQKSKKGNKNAKKPDGPIEYNPNKKARGHAPSSIQGPPTRAEEQEREYYNSVFKGQDFSIAAMPELQDPLEHTQDLLPHRKRAHRYPLPPPVKTNPFREAQKFNEYDDPTSLSRSNRSSEHDNTERNILVEEGMVTPTRSHNKGSPTTPEILSALKDIESPVSIPQPPSPSPLPPIYSPMFDSDFELIKFNEIETLPSTPKSKGKSKSKSKRKRGGKSKKSGKPCNIRKTLKKSKKRNTKKRGKY